MAFTASGLRLMVPGIGGGPQQFVYTSGDAHTDVDATDYFTSGADYGMKVGDLVEVVYTTGYLRTSHAVSAVDSDGNATISAAVLA